MTWVTVIVLNLDSDQKICVTLSDVFVLNIDFIQKCVMLSHGIYSQLGRYVHS